VDLSVQFTLQPPATVGKELPFDKLVVWILGQGNIQE